MATAKPTQGILLKSIINKYRIDSITINIENFALLLISSLKKNNQKKY